MIAAFLERFLENTLNYGREASPWLLLGFLFAGLLKVFASPSLLYRHLGGGGLRSILLATMIGIPLPLCSCGAIPVGVGLYRQGASKAATLAFFISTPATTVTAVILAIGMLGWRFAVAEILVCFGVAFLTGVFASMLSGKSPAKPLSIARCSSQLGFLDLRSEKGLKGKLEEALRYGFVDMVDDIGLYVLVGLLITGFVAALIPSPLVKEYLGGGVASLLFMALIGTPIYVCSTASIPFVAALVEKGMHPTAGLVFLIAGPATNLSTIIVVGKTLGRGTAALYVTSVIALSVFFAYMLYAVGWL